MIKLGLLLSMMALSFLFSSCSKENSVFDSPIQKDRGYLKFQNSDGFIGAVAVGTTLDYELTLKSTGGLDVTNIVATLVTSDPILYKDGAYPGTGGTCGSELKSGRTCKIILTYSPVDLASHAASLRFSFSDTISASTYDFDLSADSHPILTFEYGSLYDFGNRFVGSTTDLRIKISNTGKVNAESVSIQNFSAPFSYKGGSFPGVGGTCGARIVSGQSCEIIITYSPTSNGQHLQDITLNYLNAGRTEENTLNLMAWGFNESQLSISSVGGNDFGTVPNNNSTTKTYTVTHVGGDVSANLLTLAGLSAPFSRVGGSCGSVLSIDQGSCTIIIGLNSSTSGTWSKTMSFSYFNGTSTITLNNVLTGVTKERPVLSLTPSGLSNFGLVKVGSSSTIPFTVSYVSGELAATSISLGGYSAPFSVTGGTCGSSLSSGNCTINVRFAPTAYSIWTQAITLNYNNTVSTISASGSSITGRSDGKITPAGATLSFGTVVPGQNKDLSVRIDYSGGAPVTNISVQSLTGPYTFVSGDYPGSTSNVTRCSTSLSSGSCYLFLRFSPTAEGNFNTNSLVLVYDNGVNQSTMSLTLNGTGAPVANLVLQNKDYGSTPMNSAVAGPSLVRITNTSVTVASSLVVTLPAGFTYRGGAYPGLSGTCTNSLSGNANCNLDIAFTPLQVNTYSSTLSASYNDGVSTQTSTSTLTGEGTASSELYLSNFDQVTYASIFVGRTPYETKVFKVGHGGSSTPATINSKSFTSSNFIITADNCPNSLTNGETCSVTVAFAPQAGAAITSSFQVRYDNGGGEAIASRTLKGTGLATAVITATPTTLNFGPKPTGASYDLDLTLNKTGAATNALIGSVTGSGFSFKGGSYPGSGGTCPTSGAFPASCKVVITFTPSALVSYNGSFNLSYSNGYQSILLTTALVGSGSPSAKLSFVSAPYAFGQVIQTSSAEKTITVTNTGTDTATSMSFSGVVAPFRTKGGTCNTTLGVSQSCTLVVEFAPTTVGLSTKTLTLNYQNGSGPTSTSTTLSGEGLAQAIISLSGTNPYSFGTTNVGGSIDKSLTLTNAGSVSGTNIAGSFTSVFSFKGGSFPGTGGTCTTSLAAGTSCSVVVTFSPLAANSYSGLFSLSYNDGLRAQTELKNLSGTGSARLLELNLFKLIRPKVVALDELSQSSKKIRTKDLNLNGFQDEIEGHNSKRFVLKARDGLDQTIIYKLENHLPSNFYQGLNVLRLSKDFNHDQLPDLLMGIYKESRGELRLVGFDVVCLRTGDVLVRYLPHNSTTHTHSQHLRPGRPYGHLRDL